MKKMILSLVAAIVAATATYAQNSLVATLTHEGTSTAYYGPTALVQAHEAAVDGDVITLSSGTFNPTDITKGITLRGAGATVDLDNHIEPTIISGYFAIGTYQTTNGLIIEGIYNDNTIYYTGTINKALFVKNRFKRFAPNNTSSYLIENTFVNCIFTEGISGTSSNGSATLMNCVVFNDYTTYNLNCTNCVIAYPSYYNSCTLRNCILLGEDGEISASNSVYRCISDYEYAFDAIPNTTNYVVSMDDLFKNNNIDINEWNDLYNFELKDEAKTTYPGIDGTEIGIYGGDLPFNLIPSNPQITRFDMNSNAENGKLTVKINVQ